MPSFFCRLLVQGKFMGKGAVYIKLIRCSKTLCTITEVHDALMNYYILKNMSSILISLTGIKNKLMLFFACVLWFPFFLKIFSTLFTWTCFKCLLHMNNHKYEVVLFTCVKESSRWNGRCKNIYKKSTIVSHQRYPDSRHLFQNPKVHQSVMGFSNRAQSFITPYYLEVDSPLHFLLSCVGGRIITEEIFIWSKYWKAS